MPTTMLFSKRRIRVYARSKAPGSQQVGSRRRRERCGRNPDCDDGNAGGMQWAGVIPWRGAIVILHICMFWPGIGLMHVPDPGGAAGLSPRLRNDKWAKSWDVHDCNC